MAQQNINIGSSANKGDGDPIRTAFTKVNENFTELFAKHDGTIAQKADIQGSVFADDSTVIIDAVSSKVNLDGTVKGNIIPDTDVTYDIGSSTKRFKDLYLSGNTIHLGTSTLSVDANGNFQLSGGLKSNNPIVGDDSTLLVDTANSSIPYAVLSGNPTTVAGYGITDALALGTSATTALAGDTTFSFADITSKPTTIAGYGITDALALGTSATTALAGDTTFSFASITSQPTTLAGYGITDAQALLVSATNIKTINGATILGSGDLTVSGSSDDTLQDWNADVTLNSGEAYVADDTGYTDVPITTTDTSYERFKTDAPSGGGIIGRDLPDLADAQFGKKVYFRSPNSGLGTDRINITYLSKAGTKSSQSFHNNTDTDYLFTWYGNYWLGQQVI